MKKFSLFLAFIAAVALSASAATRYVKPGAGSAAWAGQPDDDVYENIAAAIAAATAGDEIWVAQGSYAVSAALSWKNGVDVYGGFVGNETDKGQRNSDASLTVIARSSGATRILAATAALATPTTWSGFTIQNATGGGVQMHANCILDNCIVRNNARSGAGAGILADANTSVISADMVIQSCKIINNQASGNNAGGGIYARAAGTSTGKLILKNSVIANNNATNNGGGIAVMAVPSEITNCTFAKNNRNVTGGWPGGATYLNNAKTTITNCIFWGNNDAYSRTAATCPGGTCGAKPDIYIQPGLPGCSVKNCIVSRPLTKGAMGSGFWGDEYDIIDEGSNVTLEKITVLASPADNTELLFALPSSAAGYSANSTANLNADWSILSGSIARDSGVTITDVTPATDITGRARPKFTGIDVGAYEYAAAIDIAAGANSTTSYDADTMGDVIIHADNSGTGQWSAAATTVTDGAIKLVKEVEADKLYAIGFPFAVSKVDRAFKTLQSYNDATNRFVDAASIEAGRGYLVSFAADGPVTFTSVLNPTLAIAYPATAAEYNLLPSLSLQNVTGIGGAVKYYSYDAATGAWGDAEDAIAGGALKPFDAVIASTATADYYANIGKGLSGLKLLDVAIAGEKHVTITEPATGAFPYEMGFAGDTFDLKFKVDDGYVISEVSIKNGAAPDVPYTLAPPAGGVYTVSINPIGDSALTTVTLTTKKPQFDVTVTASSGVNIALPAAGSSPYKVYYDSAFVLKFTLDHSVRSGYLPLVTLGSAAPAVPPAEGDTMYVVSLASIKKDTAIAVTLGAKKTVTLTAGAGVDITSPAAGAGSYVAPQGGAFPYAFTVQAGYDSSRVNGVPTKAGSHLFPVSDDTTISITASLAKWKVALNGNGALTDITLEPASAYPAGGYRVENGSSIAIQFKPAAGKYPAATLPKGVAYILTKAADVYTLTLPAVTDSVNITLLAQDALSLPKAVAPVTEDAASSGAGTGNFNAASLFVINKGASSGDSYSTHLKFDLSTLPLATLAQFPSVQLKLTTGWQAGDAAGAQWLVTETEDSWSESKPFLQSASPAPVDTIGAFTFGDIHPATPTANVDVYVDLTDYVAKWLAAPERASDKVLSLRLYNTLQTNNGGEVDLKSKELAGDFGPKLIFGSVSTAITDLTVDGASIYQAGQQAYFRKVAGSEIGSKMPAVAYTLSGEVDASLVDISPVTYTPADSTITAGQKNVITFTIAPKAALKGEGVSRKYTVTFRIPMVIGATETKMLADYVNGGHGDIIFNANDIATGQLMVSAAGGLPVQGAVKVVRTFEAGKFYAVGFPFDATPSVAPSELLTYDGAQLQPATAIKKDTGYLIKFAAAGEVTFTSTDNPVLPSATSMIPTASATASYRFIANPCVSNVLYVLSMTSGAYYRYNSEGHYFQKVATPVTNTNPVKPFEGIIISTNRTAEYISLGSTSKLPREVTYTKSVGVSITSGQQAATMVPYDSAFVLTFTVDSGYTAPEVTVGSSAYTLGAPDAAGAYSVRIDAVTQDTAIGITVTRKRYSVQVNTNGVAQVTEPVASPPYMVWHDSTFTLKFTLNAGYENLQVSVGSAAPYAPGSDTSGAYTVAIGSVKGDSTINIAASLKRFSVGVASGSSVVVGSSLPQDVAYGDTLTFTFTLSAHYVNPQVTLNGAGYALAPPADGVYTVTVPSVTSSVSISVSATLESLDVTVTADHVTVTSHSQANASSYTVLYGSEDTLTFTVDEFYVNPQVTVNGESYTLAAPVNDVYTVITLITENTAVSITASLEEFDLMLTVGENITLVAPAAAGSVPAAYGSELVVSFRVAAGYAPVVKTDGISVEVGAPSADGLYTVTAVEQVTGEHYIALTATRVETPNAVYKEDPSDPVVHVQYYTVVGQEVRKPVRTELLIVKRTHASKKVVVRKEMVVVN